jgi:hypothetical protein
MPGMTASTASGTFDLHDWTQQTYDDQPGAHLAKASNRKTFHGDIVGTSVADLIFVAVPNDAGEFAGRAYVGVERITGRVHGRCGSFVVTHTADMATGMTVAVVAGSATEELHGLTGQLKIDRSDDGSHTYTFDYELP